MVEPGVHLVHSLRFAQQATDLICWIWFPEIPKGATTDSAFSSPVFKFDPGACRLRIFQPQIGRPFHRSFGFQRSPGMFVTNRLISQDHSPSVVTPLQLPAFGRWLQPSVSAVRETTPIKVCRRIRDSLIVLRTSGPAPTAVP